MECVIYFILSRVHAQRAAATTKRRRGIDFFFPREAQATRTVAAPKARPLARLEISIRLKSLNSNPLWVPLVTNR